MKNIINSQNQLVAVRLRRNNRAIITVSCPFNKDPHMETVHEIQQAVQSRFGFLPEVIIRNAIPFLTFNYKTTVRELSDAFDTARHMVNEVKSIVEECSLANAVYQTRLVSVKNQKGVM